MKQLAEQMQKKQAAAEQPARSKYGNVKTGRDALRFDSKKEARRFDELLTMQQVGEIKDLRRADGSETIAARRPQPYIVCRSPWKVRC